MMDQKMVDALNEQINREIFSAYLYAAIGAYFDGQNLSGCAKWMNMQVTEELSHAAKLVGFISERGGRVKYAAIDAPQEDWDSPLAAFQAAYEHECMISGCFNKLTDLAQELSDHATEIFLQWFVTEQVEEEASVESIVQKLALVKDAPAGLFMIDRECGMRAAQAH